MMYRNRRYPRLYIALLVAACCLALSAKAEGPENARIAGTDTGSTIAFILFVSGRPQGVMTIPISDIRAAVSNQLTTTLSDQGYTVIPAETVLPLMREWRVRDGKSIPRDFLENLVDSLGIDLLLVANLVIQPGRVIMTGRYLDSASAILLKVNMTEYAIDQRENESARAVVADWLVGIREASRITGDAHFETSGSGGAPALILDTRPVGCSETIALIAGHALLGYYIEYGTWNLIDPAVIAATLQGAGFSGTYLGPEARALLRETFASPILMMSELISYDPARQAKQQLDRFEDDVDQVEPMILDFAMSLRSIDLASGSITAGKEVFMAVPKGFGWFGIPIKQTMMTRMKVAAGRLCTDMHITAEEF